MNNKSIIKFSKCCAHFYGVVTFTDIKHAINHYNHETVDEIIIKEVLEAFVSKRTTIQLYKNFVYKARAFNDTSDVERLYKKS